MRTRNANSTRAETLDAKRETVATEPMAEGVIPLRINGQRDWDSLSDGQLVKYGQSFMKEKSLKWRTDIHKIDRGLYNILWMRNLLAKIGPIRRIDWKTLDDGQLVQNARDYMKKNHIARICKLKNINKGLYEALLARKLTKIFGEPKIRPKRDWVSLPDDQLIQLAKSLIQINNVTTRNELIIADSGLHEVLRKRMLLHEVGLKQTRRAKILWDSMTDEKIIKLAQSFIEEKGVNSKSELSLSFYCLYDNLRKRKLLKNVCFRKKDRNWSSLTNDELLHFAQSFMNENKITGRSALKETDSGLYEILRLRKLLSLLFDDIEKSKRHSLERDLLSGLLRAPEAMEKFGEGK